MGKRSDFERKPRDFYPTPREAIEPLIPHLNKHFTFTEPCAGNGVLIDHLESNGGYCVWASDIEPQKEGIVSMDFSEIELVEMNEAFAAQSLAVIQELDLDPKAVNPLGGAIALGHPLGATGSIRTATLLHHLKRTNTHYGMVTMCVGSGMGAAGIFEAL